MPFGFGRKSKAPPIAASTPGGDEAPGWDAIDDALRLALPGQEPIHWGADRLPGRDGIQGLSGYRDGPNWFFVTYGLSELFGKESDDPAVSGWGLELTMRVPGSGSEPPAWPRVLLDQLAGYVYSSAAPFAAGHRFDARQPITGGKPKTRLTAVAFAVDPQLGGIDTPNGRVEFLVVVGISADELARMKASSTAEVLEELANENPLLTTDPNR